MKNKLIIILTIFYGIGIPGLHAQTKKALSLSMQQAIQIGLKNRYDVKANKYNIKLAENSLEKSKKAWIPDIQASGRIQYNSQLQPTYIPAGFVGLTEPELLAFGAKSNAVFGLDLNETLYKPGVVTNIKIAKTNVALQQEKVRAGEIEIKNKIAIAYLNVLLRKLQYKIAKSDEARFDEYLNLAEGKYKDGVLLKNDFLRVKLDDQNAKIQTRISRQRYDLSLQHLKFQMNIKEDVPVVLSDSIGNIHLGESGKYQSNPVGQRTEIEQLKLKQRIDKLQLVKVREAALPAISLFGNYSQQFLSNQFDYGNSKWWMPFSYFGVRLTIPITGNFKNYNNIKQGKLKIEQNAWRIKQEESTIRYQIQEALTDLENASQNMQKAKENYALSQEIYKNQKQQFLLGVFEYGKLLDTEKSLSIAEQNYIGAVYEYCIYKLNYIKVMDRL